MICFVMSKQIVSNLDRLENFSYNRCKREIMEIFLVQNVAFCCICRNIDKHAAGTAPETGK